MISAVFIRFVPLTSGINREGHYFSWFEFRMTVKKADIDRINQIEPQRERSVTQSQIFRWKHSHVEVVSDNHYTLWSPFKRLMWHWWWKVAPCISWMFRYWKGGEGGEGRMYWRDISQVGPFRWGGGWSLPFGKLIFGGILDVKCRHNCIYDCYVTHFLKYFF